VRTVIGVRIVVVAMMLGGLLGGFNAPAMAHGRRCTVHGTNSPDVLPGTANADRICANNGNDSIESLAGNDVIWAGKGTILSKVTAETTAYSAARGATRSKETGYRRNSWRARR
jgi:hypothetical protein